MIEFLRPVGSVDPPESAVLLVAQAAYHLDELIPLRDALRRRAVSAEVVVPVLAAKPLRRLRPSHRRHRELLAACQEPVGRPVPWSRLLDDSRSLVVMNDWGPTRALVEYARSRGKATFGLVEGVQDFDDVDTGKDRRAYRYVDHVLCIGAYDRRHLPGADCTVVGSTRLRAIWEAPPAVPDPPGHVTINSNFTYGVLTEVRGAWVHAAIGACDEARRTHALSRHAAERALVTRHRGSRIPASALLAHSSYLISRFSTLGLEALTRGVELLYFNPHGERVGMFEPIERAVVFCPDVPTLVSALSTPTEPATVRDAAAAFLADRVQLTGPVPAETAAEVIMDRSD